MRATHSARPVLATVCLVTGLLAARAATAAPVGSECSLGAIVIAQSGLPGQLQSNQKVFPAGTPGVSSCAESVTTSGRVDDARSTAGGPQVYTFEQSATATANATANIGRLGASATASARSTPESYLFSTPSNTGGIAENFYRAEARASAVGGFNDEILVLGPGFGGSVTLRFELEVHGTLIETPFDPVGAASTELNASLFVKGGQFSSTTGILSRSAPGRSTRDVSFRNGTTITLSGSISANAFALAGREEVCTFRGCFFQTYVESANADVQASNTAGFRIEVLTEGGSIVAASGHDYFAPVPLPAAVGPFAIALLGLTGLRRRLATHA